jgi:hypothetical protein
MTCSLLAAGSLMVGTSALAVDVVIDPFSSDQLVASIASGGTPANSTVADGSIIGGFREMTASGGASTFGTLGRVENDVLSFANTPESAGSLLVSYGTNGDMNIDLTDGGNNTGFLFTVEFADFPVDYTISATSSGGAIADITGTLPSGITGGGDEVDVFIAFNSANFNDTDTLSILFEGNSGIKASDLIISNLRTSVPEPSSLALLGLGGLAMIRRRRS